MSTGRMKLNGHRGKMKLGFYFTRRSNRSLWSFGSVISACGLAAAQPVHVLIILFSSCCQKTQGIIWQLAHTDTHFVLQCSKSPSELQNGSHRSCFGSFLRALAWNREGSYFWKTQHQYPSARHWDQWGHTPDRNLRKTRKGVELRTAPC